MERCGCSQGMERFVCTSLVQTRPEPKTSVLGSISCWGTKIISKWSHASKLGAAKWDPPLWNLVVDNSNILSLTTSLNQRANYLHFAWDKPDKPWARLLVLPGPASGPSGSGPNALQLAPTIPARLRYSTLILRKFLENILNLLGLRISVSTWRCLWTEANRSKTKANQ